MGRATSHSRGYRGDRRSPGPPLHRASRLNLPRPEPPCDAGSTIEVKVETLPQPSGSSRRATNTVWLRVKAGLPGTRGHPSGSQAGQVAPRRARSRTAVTLSVQLVRSSRSGSSPPSAQRARRGRVGHRRHRRRACRSRDRGRHDQRRPGRAAGSRSPSRRPGRRCRSATSGASSPAAARRAGGGRCSSTRPSSIDQRGRPSVTGTARPAARSVTWMRRAGPGRLHAAPSATHGRASTRPPRLRRRRRRVGSPRSTPARSTHRPRSRRCRRPPPRRGRRRAAGWRGRQATTAAGRPRQDAVATRASRRRRTAAPHRCGARPRATMRADGGVLRGRTLRRPAPTVPARRAPSAARARPVVDLRSTSRSRPRSKPTSRGLGAAGRRPQASAHPSPHLDHQGQHVVGRRRRRRPG